MPLTRQGSASSTQSTFHVPPGTSAGSEALPLKAADRKKFMGVAMRRWVRVDTLGQASMLMADKSALTHRLGVQLRDLRLLDPHLAQSYPSAILCREQALVVNLEHIKCIITTDQVLVLNPDDDAVLAFLDILQQRLQPAHAEGGSTAKLADSQSSPNLAGLHAGNGVPGQEDGAAVMAASAVRQQAQLAALEARDMPFELRALEVVLDTVCSHLEKTTSELEAAAHPALDALTKKVTTHNLERVRRIKNRMVRLNTRVETIHELLEKLLDDDGDMKDMNLTARQQELFQREVALQQAAAASKASPTRSSSSSSSSDSSSSSSDDAEVAEVEMVLEAYFMHIDNSYNRLQTLTEYIDDTEDYINIELDNHRNQLIRVELLLTAGTFCIALVGVVAGIFGMNLNNTHQDSYTLFIVVSAVSSAAAIVIFAVVVIWCRIKGILG